MHVVLSSCYTPPPTETHIIHHYCYFCNYLNPLLQQHMVSAQPSTSPTSNPTSQPTSNPTSSPTRQPNIFNVLKYDYPVFSTLVEAIEAAGLEDALKSGGPFTVFGTYICNG